MKPRRNAANSATDERSPHDKGPSIPTTPEEPTGLALPPADAVTALRIVGSRLPEIPLPPEKRIFNLGSDDHPDIAVRVSSKMVKGERADEHVSRVHLQIHRKGSQLWIVDHGSTNGTWIKDRDAREGYIAAGDTFRVGTDVTLLAMDDSMRMLRPTLRWVLGFDAHAYVDECLQKIVAGDPLLLVGPKDCEQRYLAEQIHCTSARRALGFAAITPPLPDREQVGGLATASHGSVYLDLAEFKSIPAWFVGHLFGDTYKVRPIIASPSHEMAGARLGDLNMPRLCDITIPPIKDRRDDVPGILNSLFRQPPLNSQREVADLGDARLARMCAFEWPDNFDDLRRNAPKILAYIESGFNMEAAATRLGKKRQTISESLRRIGL